MMFLKPLRKEGMGYTYNDPILVELEAFSRTEPSLKSLSWDLVPYEIQTQSPCFVRVHTLPQKLKRIGERYCRYFGGDI